MVISLLIMSSSSHKCISCFIGTGRALCDTYRGCRFTRSRVPDEKIHALGFSVSLDGVLEVLWSVENSEHDSVLPMYFTHKLNLKRTCSVVLARLYCLNISACFNLTLSHLFIYCFAERSSRSLFPGVIWLIVYSFS